MSSASSRWSSRRRARARTSRCSSPTTRAPTLIVAVGTHATLVEFLDKGRAGMASTFLTRLRVGGKLVDAKGVSRLYRSRISGSWLVVMVLVGLLALTAALWATPGGKVLLQVLGARLDDLWSALGGIFT